MVQWTHSLPPSLLGIKTFQTHTTPHNIAAANIMSKRETETYSWLYLDINNSESKTTSVTSLV